MSDVYKKPKLMTDDERREVTKKAFPLNCAVTLSAHGIDLDRFHVERMDGAKIVGAVVGYDKSEPDCIRVRVEGRKKWTSWHKLFWERVK